MKYNTEMAQQRAVQKIRSCAWQLSHMPTAQELRNGICYLLDYANTLEKEIAAGAANTRDESKENIFTDTSIASHPESVKFGEQERLRALQSMVVSLSVSPELAPSDILRAVTMYLEEVLKS